VSVDIWLTRDIDRILLAALRANEQAMSAGLAEPDPPHEVAYHQGYGAALSTMALALGLPILPSTENQVERALVQSQVSVPSAGGFLVTGEDDSRVCDPALPCTGGEIPRGNGSAMVR
jgi:hypothetical protein